MACLKNKKYVVIFICILLIVCIAGRYFVKAIKESAYSHYAMNSYIEKNYTNIDMSSGFSILDRDFNSSSVILTGEEHAVKSNYKIKLALLKYLNQKYDVRYLLAEIGYSSSCFINQYLETGNEAKLKLVYKSLLGVAFGNKEDYSFWVELRKYNLTVPEDRRIKVIGIDIEHQMNTACEYLNYLLPENYPPEEIQSAVQRYKNYCMSIYGDDFPRTMEKLQTDMNINPDIYKKYLGNNYFDFCMVVDNVVNSINAYSAHDADFYKIREPFMYSNFLRIYAHLPAGKYFGQFGMEHVYQKICSSSFMGNTKRLAMYMNSSGSPVRGRVLSIVYGYENCTFMNWENNFSQSKCTSIIDDFDAVKKYSSSDMTLFKLNGSNSPFNKKIYFFKSTDGGCTTDYFQYLILIKNSGGTTEIGNIN